MKEFKMYVWNDPYRVSYGSSLLVVVARDLDEAKKVAASGTGYAYGEYDSPLDTQQLAERLGDPLRVVDVPCAEWHEWKE